MQDLSTYQMNKSLSLRDLRGRLLTVSYLLCLPSKTVILPQVVRSLQTLSTPAPDGRLTT